MGMEPTNNPLQEYLKVIRAGAQKESAGVEVSPKQETDEKQQLEIDGLKTNHLALKASLGRVQHVHIARLVGLGLLFLLVVFWLIIILGFVFFSGMTFEDGTFTGLKLSDGVILALIGSTTINVVGLFVIAARWLYGNHSSTPDNKENGNS